MRTSKTAANKTISKTVKLDSQADLVFKTSSIITEAISRSINTKFKNGVEGKITVHVHIGDVIMMGFDEAIDAEEWGMRENNTEIVGNKANAEKTSKGLDADIQAKKNRKISKNIVLRKGSLELNATEKSEPAIKKSSRQKIRA